VYRVSVVMKRGKAVVLLSGGIDSSTALAIAKSEGYDLYTLSFDYKQRHKIELDSAGMVASALGVRKHLIIGFDLREIGGSALTSEIEVPKNRVQGKEFMIQDREESVSSVLHGRSVTAESLQVPITYVPARNTIFLSFGLAWAEVLEAENIFIGANAIDYSGYPDCRPEYLKAFEDMANLATKASVEGRMRFKVLAPLISMKKSEIIKTGAGLGLDYSLTWSCYDPQHRKVKGEKLKVEGEQPGDSNLKIRSFELVPCGRCDSCVFRARGFREAGMEDPLLKRLRSEDQDYP
jgi:7-cyano-7-deazaguanine synthase